jgi:hypothetical protein
MWRATFLFLLAGLLVSLSTAPSYSVDLKKGAYVPSPSSANELAVTVSLLGEKGDVYRPGKEIRFSFQTTKDAYVVIYNIDSEGYINLLWPQGGRLVMSEGRKTYFIPDPGGGVHWETGDKTGVEYIHALAVSSSSRINDDELYFLFENDRLPEEKRFHVDVDPYLAFNSIDGELVNGAEQDPPATDYTYFYINRQVEYPRYLCSKCHSPEKLADPYAMQCPEIVIEKLAYEEDPHYPYPPLYDVRHVGEARSEYSSERSGERWLDEDNDNEDHEGVQDSDFYLQLGVGSYGYPYQPLWPYYEPYYPPYYWDPFWWGFGWNIYWGGYWPGFGWGYAAYYPWGYPFYWGRFGGCGFDSWSCNHRFHRRPILAERSVAKRYLDYERTNVDLRKTRALAGSRLMRTRTEEAARRLDRSTIRERAITRGLGGAGLVRPEQGVARNRETTRRIIYGGVRTRETGNQTERAVRTRSTNRSGGAADARRPASERRINRGEAPPARGDVRGGRSGDSRGRTIERSSPDRRSSEAGRRDSPRSRSSDSSTRERSRSSGGSESNVDKRRTSGYSTGAGQRSVAPRSWHSSPSRGWSGGFGSRPTGSRGSGFRGGARSRGR